MKQFAVFGLGSFGCSLATSLYKLGNDVYAIDKREEVIHQIADSVTYAIQADISDMNALRSIGLSDVDCAVIASASDINVSLMAVINASELGIPSIYAKARDQIHARVLYKLGVEKVIFPEREMGERLAGTFSNTSILDLLELDSEHSIAEAEVPTKWWNKSIVDIGIRARYKLNVLAIKRGGGVLVSPEPSELLTEGDKIVVLGEKTQIAKLTQKKLNL